MDWYKCSNCNQTKKASTAPWENGCRNNSSGMHNFQFSGNEGYYNWTCRKCEAEVYLKSGQSPAGSRCSKTGNSCEWYNK